MTAKRPVPALRRKSIKTGRQHDFSHDEAGHACAAIWQGACVTDPRPRPTSEAESVSSRSASTASPCSASSASFTSWQGLFSSSLQPSGVLARVRRAVTGQAASPEGLAAAAKGGPCSLADVKKQLLLVLDDCRNGERYSSIEGRISSADSVIELWLLRSDIYQCVARESGQGEASRRINSLLPVFEGWIPARHLAPI